MGEKEEFEFYNADSFKNRIKYNPEQNQQKPIKKANNVVYTAQKGTANRVNQQRKGSKLKLRIAALLLAGSIGLGGISLVANKLGKNNEEPITVNELTEQGIDMSIYGLSSKTAKCLGNCDEYFEDFQEGNFVDLTEQGVLDRIHEVRELHFSVVKEKMASLLGINGEDITMYYSWDKETGRYNTMIKTPEGTFTGENGKIFGGKTIPKEMSDSIIQLEEIDKLMASVNNDKISKVNAVKELKELYDKLENVATGTLSIDKKEHISFMNYEEAKENANQKIKDEER